MKKTISIFAIALLLSTSTGFTEEESREKVDFPEMMKTHMMANMRDHLMALTEIQQNMAEGEFDKAAEIAENRLGQSSLKSHGAHHMASMMPEGMQKIGTEMHKAASRFAITLQDTDVDGDLKKAMGEMSKVMAQCVACHSAYRVH